MRTDVFDLVSEMVDNSRGPLGRISRMFYDAPTDVKETETEYILTMSLSGFKKDDINIEFKDDILQISGETKEESEEKEGRYLLKERGKSSFERSFSFPNVKEKEISAKMDNGVLTLTLPKKDEKPSSKISID